MPVFELPLEQLEAYKGTNPCPADIDQFWDDALAELDKTDPCPELAPSSFQVPFADCFDLYFAGVQSARVHAKYLRPKSENNPHPAILQFHGYGIDAGDWFDKLPYVALGYSVAALDCRGQAGLSEDPGGVTGNTLNGHIIRGLNDGPAKLYYRQVFLDTVQLCRVVMAMPEVDESHLGAMGLSQGGGLTLACGALEPRIRKLAPVMPFLSDYQRVWEMDLAVKAYEELREYFRLRDPRHEREEEIFTRLGYIDVQHLTHRIRGEVLMGVGLMDQICPPSTQFAAYNKITSSKRMILYPDYAHERYPGLPDKTLEFFSDL
jgi:cephalosporin-C deacetylase